MKKRRTPKHASNPRSKKARNKIQTKSWTPSTRGLGTKIAARFHEIGLKPGEEIPELRGFQPRTPNFED